MSELEDGGWTVSDRSSWSHMDTCDRPKDFKLVSRPSKIIAELSICT